LNVEKTLFIIFAILFTLTALFVKDIYVKHLSLLYTISFVMLYAGFHIEGGNSAYAKLLKFGGFALLVYTLVENIRFLKRYRDFEKKFYTDPLTGVYNRKFLEEIFQYEIENYKKYGKEFCILFIDLNNFKQVNDMYGHKVGDEVLKKVARLIKENIRKEDYLIRYGGDEFVVITEVNHEDVLRLIGRLNEKLRLNYKGIEINVSIGSACYPVDGKDLDTLIRVADERMYKVKAFQKRLLKLYVG